MHDATPTTPPPAAPAHPPERGLLTPFEPRALRVDLAILGTLYFVRLL